MSDPGLDARQRGHRVPALGREQEWLLREPRIGPFMARGEAKRRLEKDQDDIDSEMRQTTRIFAGVSVRGVVGNTKRTPLDECGRVYKNLDAVLGVLEAEGTELRDHF